MQVHQVSKDKLIFYYENSLLIYLHYVQQEF